ncbi:MAG TPA: glycoside hydrolase family 9 protein, partial [Bryobacteraceae bacterium]|nr:glycoside hydrolase family 9 protein [Bryobacteraceae bacterium]
MPRWQLFFVLTAALCGQSAAPAPEIRVNQVGYLPGFPKHALIASSTAGDKFTVKRKGSDRIVFSGQLGPATQDGLSGDTLRSADFTSLTQPGEYVIDVENLGQSYPFVIDANAYERTYYLAMRSFYGQRCGTAVDLGEEFPGYRYEICHTRGQFHPSSGKSGERQSAYGWHDAGDYGRYVVNSGITTGTLLWTYEMFPKRVRDLKLIIPESGNATPDILDEIRWNLEWMLTMQDDDGGVWHKQTSVNFAGFVMPERDTMPSVVIGTGSAPFKNSCATGDFAAVLAIAGRLYKPFDEQFASRSTAAAARAWTWLTQHPNVTFQNPTGVATGGYGDGNCADERLWAAAELWRTTGEASYHDYFKQNYAGSLSQAGSPPGWPSVGGMALWTYVLGAGEQSDAGAVAAIRDTTVKAAKALAERTLSSPYRTTMVASDYIWGSNSVAANYSLLLLVANALQPDPRYVEAAVENLHYLLGRNAFSTSWVTQVGSNPFRKPHHRPSGADRNDEPWPGMLSGGPNRNQTQDNVLRAMPAGLPPMKYWADDQDSYAATEMAINWNAPLV